MQKYKLVFFTPRTSTQTVLQHLFACFPDHVGRIGAYGGCAFVSPGSGQFLPLEGANPVLGSVGKHESVEEDRVEVLVRASDGRSHDGAADARPKSNLVAGDTTRIAQADTAGEPEMGAVLQELKKVHPYEEVAYDVYWLENF